MATEKGKELVNRIDDEIMETYRRIKKERDKIDSIESLTECTETEQNNFLAFYSKHLYILGLIDWCEKAYPDIYDDNMEKRRKYIQNQIAKDNILLVGSLNSRNPRKIEDEERCENSGRGKDYHPGATNYNIDITRDWMPPTI